MKRLITLLILLITSAALYSQSIRKNYTEMTGYEKAALVNAFFELRNNGDLINDMSIFHNDFFNFDNTFDPTRLDIHFNLPDEPERDIFFAWHRRQIFEIEQAMQHIDPLISMPFWNSTIDQSPTSPLWDENFMGQFNAAWGLNRNLGATGVLPSPQDLVNVQSITDFLIYSNTLERGVVHAGAHRWTGGIMSGPPSPRDPIFYLHHSFIDKIWQEWQEVNQTSSFIITSMIRYDGTYSFNGQLLPLVNPNDIIDSRSLGVFYADSQQVVMDYYTVSNTYQTPETFFYQYDIEVCDNFVIPQEKESQIVSGNRIVLKPGFHAANGSKFHARIDEETTSASSQQMLASAPPAYNTKQFEHIDYQKNAYADLLENREEIKYKVHPNPFVSAIELNLKGNAERIDIWISDIRGIELRRTSAGNTSRIAISGLENLAPGMYIINIQVNGGRIMGEKIIKR